MIFGKKKSAAVKESESSARSARKAEKSSKQAAKDAKKATPAGLIGTLTDPKTARRAVAVAKIAGPALAPYALKAATNVRGYLDARRADQLGVAAEEVSAYRGPTGPIAARIASLQQSVDDLRRRRGSDLQVSRFTEVARTRLADLAAATNAAGSMPSGRRRATLGAIGKDLNQIDADLLTFLVGNAA